MSDVEKAIEEAFTSMFWVCETCNRVDEVWVDWPTVQTWHVGHKIMVIEGEGAEEVAYKHLEIVAKMNSGAYD